MKTNVLFSDNQLSADVREQMWSIYHHAYHYDRASFMDRFASNNQYAFYYHGSRLVGFTGLRIHPTEIEEKVHLLIYFGQTIILPEFRGKSLIPVTGFKLCIKYWRYFLTGRAYFWADALTYRAYLVFAKTLHTCYPSYKHTTPAKEQQLIKNIGRKYYAEHYVPESGTVSKTAQIVKERCAEIKKQDLADPDIRFYASANPLHQEGHGLITLGPVNWKNISCLVSRYLKASLGIANRKRQKKSMIPSAIKPNAFTSERAG